MQIIGIVESLKLYFTKNDFCTVYEVRLFNGGYDSFQVWLSEGLYLKADNYEHQDDAYF